MSTFSSLPIVVLLALWCFACGYFSGPLMATLFLGSIDSDTILKFFLGILGILILPRKIWRTGFAIIFSMGSIYGLNWIFKRFWETLQLPQGPALPSVGEIVQIVFCGIYFLLFIYLLKDKKSKDEKPEA